MILKGSQRGGGEQLAAHLMNDRDNDHVTLHELRGFMSEDLSGALGEAHAVSKGTRCRQFIFSLSLNPPKGAACSIGDLMEAVERAERALGLIGQQRAVVVHEKEGRRHAHVVWSRIDVATMKAIELPFFKNRLASLSKELYLDNGWELPEGHRENGWKNPLNFTLAEWQQAKRIGLHPKEIMQLFADAWRYSDGLKSFTAALEDRGYFLAAGNRRGFVAVDINGEVFSVSRMLGVKTKDLEARLGSPANLPTVVQVTDQIARRMSEKTRAHMRDLKSTHVDDMRPLFEDRARIVRAQRLERERMRAMQDARLMRERAERQSRFKTGVRGLWDVLTGRAAVIRRENDRATFAGYQRDIAQREALYWQQLEERSLVQERIAMLRREHRQSIVRLGQRVASLLSENAREFIVPYRGRQRGLGMP